METTQTFLRYKYLLRPHVYNRTRILLCQDYLISPASCELLKNRDLTLLPVCTCWCLTHCFPPHSRSYRYMNVEWHLNLWIKREKCMTQCQLTSLSAAIISLCKMKNISVLSGVSSVFMETCILPLLEFISSCSLLIFLQSQSNKASYITDFALD